MKKVIDTIPHDLEFPPIYVDDVPKKSERWKTMPRVNGKFAKQTQPESQPPDERLAA